MPFLSSSRHTGRNTLQYRLSSEKMTSGIFFAPVSTFLPPLSTKRSFKIHDLSIYVTAPMIPMRIAKSMLPVPGSM